MRFAKFQIENFKGIDKINVNLDAYDGGNVITLVGLNESGKTTVLDAIDFFQQDSLSSKDRYRLIPKKRGYNFTGEISVEATLKLSDEDEKSIKEFAREKTSFSINSTYKIKELRIKKFYSFKDASYVGDDIQYSYKIVGQDQKSGHKQFAALAESDTRHKKIGDYIFENLCPYIIYYKDFLFDFPAKIYLEPKPGESEAQDTYRQVIQDILHSINSSLNVENNLLSKLKKNTPENQSALVHILGLMGNAITNEVVDSWGHIFDDDWQGKEVTISYGVENVDIEIPPAPDNPSAKLTKKKAFYYLQFKIKEGAKHFEISERSLGFKWFFTFLLFTRFRLSRKTDPGETLFLLDEPASNLHSTAQQKLTKGFEKLTSQQRVAKLIFSTHSHHLIRSEWLESSYIVKNSAIDYDASGLSFEPKETEITLTPYKKFVATHPNQKSYFQPILDSLDYKPSSLELVPEIIIVEGKHDFYTYKYIQDIVLESSKPLKFYPGNGCGGNEEVIRLYEAWGAKYLVLLDSDPKGIRAIQQYKDNIGEFIVKKIYGLKDISNSWNNFSTEQLFTEKDSLKIIQLLNPNATQFSKTLFNESIKTLLLQKKKVELSKTTINRFNKIFVFIKKKL